METQGFVGFLLQDWNSTFFAESGLEKVQLSRKRIEASD